MTTEKTRKAKRIYVCPNADGSVRLARPDDAERFPLYRDIWGTFDGDAGFLLETYAGIAGYRDLVDEHDAPIDEASANLLASAAQLLSDPGTPWEELSESEERRVSDAHIQAEIAYLATDKPAEVRWHE